MPLGGEDWEISKSGSTADQQLAFDYIEGLQSPSEELNLAKQFGYLPARISVAKTYVKEAGPAVERARDADPVRASAHARSRHEVQHDLHGSVGRDLECLGEPDQR